MSQILKEYLILIILAALAVAGVIWYLRKTAKDATAGIKQAAQEYKEDVSTITSTLTSASGVKDLFGGLFQTTKYISQEDQRKALAEINARMFKRK